MPVPFCAIANLGDRLQAATSRSALARLLGEFLRTLPHDQVRPAGLGLRFTRILRFREDKPVVDSIQFLRALYQRELARSASQLD